MKQFEKENKGIAKFAVSYIDFEITDEDSIVFFDSLNEAREFASELLEKGIAVKLLQEIDFDVLTPKPKAKLTKSELVKMLITPTNREQNVLIVIISILQKKVYRIMERKDCIVKIVEKYLKKSLKHILFLT